MHSVSLVGWQVQPAVVRDAGRWFEGLLAHKGGGVMHPYAGSDFKPAQPMESMDRSACATHVGGIYYSGPTLLSDAKRISRTQTESFAARRDAVDDRC